MTAAIVPIRATISDKADALSLLNFKRSLAQSSLHGAIQGTMSGWPGSGLSDHGRLELIQEALNRANALVDAIQEEIRLWDRVEIVDRVFS